MTAREIGAMASAAADSIERQAKASDTHENFSESVSGDEFDWLTSDEKGP